MKNKKWLAILSCVSALGMLSACSGDSDKEDNPVNPPIESSSDFSLVGVSSSEMGMSSLLDVSSSSVIMPVVSSSSESGIQELSSSVDVTDKNTYMMITEIMYNAPNGSDLEWIEVTIQNGEDISDMGVVELHLDGAVEYDFPAGENLKKGEYIIVTNDTDLFKSTYPECTARVYGPWYVDPKTNKIAKLEKEGGAIDVKLLGDGDVSVAFGSEPPWPSLADGKGSSLVFKGGNPAQPTAWGASKKSMGNPGVGNDEYVPASQVRVNEIKPFVLEDGEMGWVELFNMGSEPMDVAGWEFKSKLKGKSWTIGGTSTVVPAGGYLVLPATADVFGEDLYVSPNGGEFFLYQVVNGEKTGAESSVKLAASKGSSGVVDLTDGATAQGALMTETPGAANSALKVGPIFINEIHYHENAEDGNDAEFIELVNMGTEPVRLYETVNSKSKGWKIEGINMEFKSGDEIPAGGMMVLFRDSIYDYLGDDENVRFRYDIPANVLVGSYKGKLSNRGELIALKRPVDYYTSEDGEQWYFDWSDATIYSDRWPGLQDADGFGKSLHRKDFTTMGYESSAWELGVPSPGK